MLCGTILVTFLLTKHSHFSVPVGLAFPTGKSHVCLMYLGETHRTARILQCYILEWRGTRSPSVSLGMEKEVQVPGQLAQHFPPTLLFFSCPESSATKRPATVLSMCTLDLFCTLNTDNAFHFNHNDYSHTNIYRGPEGTRHIYYYSLLMMTRFS